MGPRQVHGILDFLKVGPDLRLRSGLIQLLIIQRCLHVTAFLGVYPALLSGPGLRLGVPMLLTLQHSRPIEILGAQHLKPIALLLHDELLGWSLSLGASLSSLEALQARVVDLYLLQVGAGCSVRGPSSNLRISYGLCQEPRRSLALLNSTFHRSGLLLLLRGLLSDDLLHVVDFGLFVLVIEVASTAAMVIDHKLIAPPVDLGDHLVLL